MRLKITLTDDDGVRIESVRNGTAITLDWREASELFGQLGRLRHELGRQKEGETEVSPTEQGAREQCTA